MSAGMDMNPAKQAEEKPRTLQADELLNGIAEEMRDRLRQIAMQIDRLAGEREAVERVLSRINPSPPMAAAQSYPVSAPGVNAAIVSENSQIVRRF